MFPQCVNEALVEGFSAHPLPQAVATGPRFLPRCEPKSSETPGCPP